MRSGHSLKKMYFFSVSNMERLRYLFVLCVIKEREKRTEENYVYSPEEFLLETIATEQVVGWNSGWQL